MGDRQNLSPHEPGLTSSPPPACVRAREITDLLLLYQEAAGFAIEIEVDWDQVAEEEMGHMYNENLTKVYFLPLIDGLKAITVDDMGREALKEKISKIVIRNATGNYYGSDWSKLQDGVLVIDHKPNSNVDSGNERIKGLVSELEANL